MMRRAKVVFFPMGSRRLPAKKPDQEQWGCGISLRKPGRVARRGYGKSRRTCLITKNRPLPVLANNKHAGIGLHEFEKSGFSGIGVAQIRDFPSLSDPSCRLGEEKTLTDHFLKITRRRNRADFIRPAEFVFAELESIQRHLLSGPMDFDGFSGKVLRRRGIGNRVGGRDVRRGWRGAFPAPA